MSLEHRKKLVLKIITKLKKLYPNPKSALNYSNPFEFLVAVMLSAQNTDKGVNKVTDILFKKYLTLDDCVSTDTNTFDQDIKSINFHSTKAKNVLAAAKIIKEKFVGKVPDTMEDLLSLPGVGRKTANVILGNVYNKPVGIAVDTHVRRLSKLYGLTDHTDPEKIERDLMEIVPKEYWTNFTHFMILYGRDYCTARKHKHKECPLTNIKYQKDE